MHPLAWTRLARATLPGGGPGYLIAFVTGRCPLRCQGCCHAARSVRGADELSVEQWARALEGLRGLIHLTITGGEPFERQDLGPLVTAMVEASGAPRFSLDSAGQQPERIAEVMAELLARLPGRDASLFLSLDGPAALHDGLRGRPGAFDAVQRTVRLLEPLRPRLSVRLASLLQPGNQGRLAPLLDETAHWPVDHHEIIMLRDVPLTVQRDLLAEYALLSERQLERCSARFGRGLEWRLARAVRREVIRRVQSPERAPPCRAGRDMVEVLPDGTVLGCELEKVRGRAVLGHIGGGQRLVDVLRGPARQDFARLAAGCSCTFECAITCDLVFRPRRWRGLL